MCLPVCQEKTQQIMNIIPNEPYFDKPKNEVSQIVSRKYIL